MKDTPEKNIIKPTNTHDELSDLQKEILSELSKTKGSEERVRRFGKIVDDYGVDALLGLFPAAGDVSSSLVSGIYLLMESKIADLDKGAMLRIIGLQTADAFVGLIPFVGDVADYFFKANKWSVRDFEKRTVEIEEKARELGCTEEQIANVRKKASELPRIVEKVITPHLGKKR